MFKTSPLDAHIEHLQLWLDAGKTNDEIVNMLWLKYGVRTSEASVRRAINRLGLTKQPSTSTSKEERPGLEITEDAAVITGEVNEDLGDAETMIKNRGLNPDDWHLEKVTVNEWEGFYKTPEGDAEKVTLRQLKVYLKRKVALKFIMPAIDVEVLPAPKRRDTSEQITLAVIVGDEQEPYSDPVLKELFVAWLAHNKPERGVHLGDLMDFPTISRHKDNPEWAATVQECIDAGYSTLKEYRVASPDTSWEFLVGNHDERLRNELLLRAERMYGIKPAANGQRQDDVLSIAKLLHFEELGIKFIDPEGGYEHAKTYLNPNLIVKHGIFTGPTSAEKTLDRMGCSVIYGHDHTQKIHSKTFWRGDNFETLHAVAAGCMCKAEGGIGYTVNPNWQNGFATATLFPDGSYNVELGTYSNGVLKWRDQKYTI